MPVDLRRARSNSGASRRTLDCDNTVVGRGSRPRTATPCGALASNCTRQCNARSFINSEVVRGLSDAAQDFTLNRPVRRSLACSQASQAVLPQDPVPERKRPQSAPAGSRRSSTSASKLAVPAVQGLDERPGVHVDSYQQYTKVFSLEDLQNQVKYFSLNLNRVWGSVVASTTPVPQTAVNSIKVYYGKRVCVAPIFLLAFFVQCAKCNKDIKIRQGQKFHKVLIPMESANLPYVLLLLTMRWFLQLYAACSELDCKLLSFSNVIYGLQYVALEQYENCGEASFGGRLTECNPFTPNLNTIIDDIVDQLQRSLGSNWMRFLEYVATCNPNRCVYFSKTNSIYRNGSRLDRFPVASHASLALPIDTAFVAAFVRQRRGDIGQSDFSGHLKSLYECLTFLDVPFPELPPLKDVAHLTAWLEEAQARPRFRGSRSVEQLEAARLALLEAVLLSVALELHHAEVLEPPTEEDGCQDAQLEQNLPIGEVPPPQQPPRAIKLKAHFLDVAMQCIRHHSVIPEGIRLRLSSVLTTDYSGVSDNSVEVALCWNSDCPHMTDAGLRKMAETVSNRFYGAKESGSLVSEVDRKNCKRLLWPV